MTYLERILLPGFALNVGAWHRACALGGYALFYAVIAGLSLTFGRRTAAGR